TNWRFVGQSAEVGHLFIYKPFDLPYEIIVRPGKDTNGHQNFEVHDSHRTRRFHNAAQLSLAVCSIIEHTGPKEVEEFVNLIEQFVDRDYHVILATADDAAAVQRVADTIQSELRSEPFNHLGQEVIARVHDAEPPGLEETIRQGGRLCDIEESIR